MTEAPAKLNLALMEAVTDHQVEAVALLLAKGADPNHLRPPIDGVSEDEHQPTTPLRMVIFRISDALLEDEDLAAFEAIAGLLLEHGADPEPARRLARLRYGSFPTEDDPASDSPFLRVWRLVEGPTT